MDKRVLSALQARFPRRQGRVRLLEALNRSGKVLGFKELLAISGLSRSAANRALKGMVVQGVVARVARGKYREVPLFAGEGA